MRTHLRRQLSFANVISVIALLVALSGTAYAAATITGVNIKNGTVTTKDIKDYTLQNRDLRNGSVRSNSVADGTLDIDDLSGVTRSELGGVYARISNSGATLAKSKSWGPSTVTHPAVGYYCIIVPTLATVVSAVATIDYVGSTTAAGIQTATGAHGSCTGATDVTVFTEFDAGATTNPNNQAFFVHIYGTNS